MFLCGNTFFKEFNIKWGKHVLRLFAQVKIHFIFLLSTLDEININVHILKCSSH